MVIGATVKFMAITAVLWGFFMGSAACANDFPTQARVEYIDKIAAEITYEEYVEGDVFAQLRATPGERGGVFRDPDRASQLVRQLTEVTEVAEKSCFIQSGTGTAEEE